MLVGRGTYLEQEEMKRFVIAAATAFAASCFAANAQETAGKNEYMVASAPSATAKAARATDSSRR